MRTWRKREKNPCVYGECAKRICAHMEKKHKESMLTRRMRKKNLCVHGERRKRIYAYMENAGKESMRTWRKRKIIIINNLIT
jgi:hypothetical protein